MQIPMHVAGTHANTCYYWCHFNLAYLASAGFFANISDANINNLLTFLVIRAVIKLTL